MRGEDPPDFFMRLMDALWKAIGNCNDSFAPPPTTPAAERLPQA